MLKFTRVWALSLGLLLLLSAPLSAQTITTPSSVEVYTKEELFLLLESAKVIYLGETHDSKNDHDIQLEIIQKLFSQNSKIAVAMEMFQRPFQGVLDDYLAGKISEMELFERSEYQQRWGYDWEFYAPILRFAKANQLPVIALNTPAEVTRKVARQGLESLTEAERQYIPPITEIRAENGPYKQMIREIWQQHSGAGQGFSQSFENFFLAQVLWDETMAESIVNFITKNPDYQVVVLAGKGHIIYGYGIPSRVQRRIEDKTFNQRSVLLNFQQGMLPEKDVPVADFLWHKD